MPEFTLYHGNCLDILKTLPPDSIDSIVTDPPYGLKFMGKRWDYDVPSVEVWAECLRVLKPGGHLLAFAGTRTQHRMAARIEDAGFEIRDMIAWVYGSGFCKSYNLRREPICTCKTSGNAIPSAHGKQETEHTLRPLREANLSEAELAGEKCDQGMFTQVQQLPSGPSATVFGNSYCEAGSDSARREQFVLEGRELYRTEQGLSAGANAESSEGEGERLRSGTHSGRGKDAGAPIGAGRGSSPRQPGQSGQPTGEPEGVFGSHNALDGGALQGRGSCSRCGKLRKDYEGFGTALKPALEPITLARKPLDGTVAQNVLEHGTGAINVDGCRVLDGTEIGGVRPEYSANRMNRVYGAGMGGGDWINTQGRWPANLIHDGSEEVLETFPQAPGQLAKAAEGGDRRKDQNVYGTMTRGSNGTKPRQDAGSAARFFYCAKASKSDRESGLDSIERVSVYCDAWESADQLATLLVDTAQSVPMVIAVSGAPNNDVHEWSTLLFGSEQTARSLTECRSTIETVTSSTTVSKTLNWLTRSLTSGCTADAKSETANGGSHAESAAIGSPSAIIISDLTVSVRGVERAQSKTRWSIKGNAGSPANHPTVKPTNLMRYLCRLVTPVGGVVLDPFMGSGSTGKAAALEGFRFVGIELDAAFVEVARRRILDATVGSP